MKDKNRITSPKSSFFVWIAFFLLGAALIMYPVLIYIQGDDPSILNFIIQASPILLIGGMFGGLGLYGTIFAIPELFSKQKEEIVYLNEINSANMVFTNKKGKKFYFMTGISKEIYTIGSYYIALKSPTFIYEIVRPTEEEFEPTEIKQSYWMNCYLPGQEFKNVLMLPVVYIIGLFALFISIGAKTIAGLPMAGMALYLIIYDYKVKKSMK